MKYKKIFYLFAVALFFQLGLSYAVTNSANEPAGHKIGDLMKSMLKPAIPFAKKKNSDDQQQQSASPTYDLIVPQSVIDDLQSSDEKEEGIKKELGLQDGETAELNGYTAPKGNKDAWVNGVMGFLIGGVGGMDAGYLVGVAVGAGLKKYAPQRFDSFKGRFFKKNEEDVSLLNEGTEKQFLGLSSKELEDFGLRPGAILAWVGIPLFTALFSIKQPFTQKFSNQLAFYNSTGEQYFLSKADCRSGKPTRKYRLFRKPRIKKGRVASIGAYIRGDKKTGIVDCTFVYRQKGGKNDAFSVIINQSQIGAGGRGQLEVHFIQLDKSVRGNLISFDSIRKASEATNKNNKKRILPGFELFDLQKNESTQSAPLATTH